MWVTVRVMDELDAVFDRWEKHKQRSQPSSTLSGQDQTIAELKAAMAASQLDAIPTLMLQFDQMGTPNWVAAMEGSLESAALGIRDLEQLRQIDGVRQAIRTKQGHLRKRLSKEVFDRINQNVMELCLVGEVQEDSEVVKLLAALERTVGLMPQTIQDLFASGIHRAGQLIHGTVGDLVSATGIHVDSIQAIKRELVTARSPGKASTEDRVGV